VTFLAEFLRPIARACVKRRDLQPALGTGRPVDQLVTRLIASAGE
jgi:hypothetical protein